jgi:AraC-like DNA-binding protein
LPPSTILASLTVDPPAAKDLRSASKIMQRLLTVRRIRAASPSPLATISMRNSRLQHVVLVTVEYSSPTSLQYEVDTDAILLEFVLQGQANHRDGQEWRPIPGNSGIVIGHGQFHQQAVQANYRSLILRLERAALEERLCVLLQRPIRQPLAFARTLDLATAGQSFWHLLRWINDELAQGGSILQHNATIVQTTEKLLLDTLLLTHQSNYSTALAAREPAAIPRHLRAVIAAIQAAPEQTWTLTAMAAHAGVSVRTLCEVFRHFRGSTPMEFVRSVRLSRTREDLKQFGPRASIAAIAKRWGFGHAGRFAAAYTRTFGETPSETLRGNKPRERDASPAICGGFSRSPGFSSFSSAND